MTNPLAGPSALKDLIQPQFHQNNFQEELFVKNELGLKLDKGKYLSIIPEFNRMPPGPTSLSSTTYHPFFAELPATKTAPHTSTRTRTSCNGMQALAACPKPSLPPPNAYEPPSPLANRDLGPPPPGYGRYADYDRLNGGSGPPGPPGSASAPLGPRRNLDDVMCFKCGEKGHYANHCRNRNVPGNRGGIDRSRRYGGGDD
ncbi:hypothetical protein ID866_5428 [Astraeus odoratus]|nr:hypothetical protein ID866_5428 [Astraeus odoratus]